MSIGVNSRMFQVEKPAAMKAGDYLRELQDSQEQAKVDDDDRDPNRPG
jgi:hypothetical protein